MRPTSALLACVLATAPLASGCSRAETGVARPSSNLDIRSEHAPQLSPRVDNPRDIRAYGDRPCEVFSVEQLTEFGFDLPPNRTQILPSGNQVCVWIDSDYLGELAVTTYPDWDILERIYANRASEAIFEPLMIAGLPAVVHQPGPVPTCYVTVGLAQRQGLDVEFSDLRQPYEDPCGAARMGAKVAVGNLPPLK